MEIKEKIKSISFNWKDEKKLTEQFAKLAPYFLYGGYVHVLDRYRVYIQRVEFYFHSEKADGIKDEIVYHRNDYHVEGNLPYFMPLTFHAHASGYDLAFENETEQYRASVLIRAYEIYDESEKKFMKAENGRFIYINEPYTNPQSTYLYDIINGFGDTGAIEWKDDASQLLNNHEELKIEKRQGVYNKDNKKWEDAFKYDEKRNRLWSFSRKEHIPII